MKWVSGAGQGQVGETGIWLYRKLVSDNHVQTVPCSKKHCLYTAQWQTEGLGTGTGIGQVEYWTISNYKPTLTLKFITEFHQSHTLCRKPQMSLPTIITTGIAVI